MSLLYQAQETGWFARGRPLIPYATDPPPDPDPGEPPTINHGDELPATSGAAEATIGAQGALTEGPSGDFTAAMGPVVVENAVFTNKNIRVRAGANVTLRNCRIIAPYGSNTYAVRINEGGNARLLMEDCTVICRTNTGDRNAVTGWGDVSLALRRCVIRGGIDGVHFHGKGPAIWPTGDSLIPMATFLMEECWLGDNERLPGSHSDLFQMAGARPNRIRDYVWRRNRFMGYSLPMYSDTLTTRADPATSSMASAGWIDSTGGQGTGIGATHLAIRDNYFEGGNYVVAGSNEDARPAAITGNRFAPGMRYGPTSGIGVWDNRDNRWATSGFYNTTYNDGTPRPQEQWGVAVAGQLIPGSTE